MNKTSIILVVIVALAMLWYLGTSSSITPSGGFKELCPPGFMLASYTSSANPCVPLQADMRYRSS